MANTFSIQTGLLIGRAQGAARACFLPAFECTEILVLLMETCRLPSGI